MKPFVRLLVVACLGTTALVIPAGPSHASWVSVNCNTRQWADSHYRRKDALAYAAVARHEGYEWGGGCWNNDDRDDTPNAPDSNGEGPDCSGLVFKTWELKATWGTSGFQYWSKWQNIHGPYASTAFHDVGTNSSLPFYEIPKITAYSRDAFARDGQVGLVYGSVPETDGTWLMLEAKGDAYGVHIYAESWLSDSAYQGVRRKGWTPECWPSCM